MERRITKNKRIVKLTEAHIVIITSKVIIKLIKNIIKN